MYSKWIGCLLAIFLHILLTFDLYDGFMVVKTSKAIYLVRNPYGRTGITNGRNILLSSSARFGKHNIMCAFWIGGSVAIFLQIEIIFDCFVWIYSGQNKQSYLFLLEHLW